ncbi:hypothetical protein KZX50_19750 [Bacillus infantis]|uniref:hypothetical protein n=1 Tax=Bacillus infantis TaxID=324767 RepID=UPI002003E373|nr:hypothetical protein [Bacillus infantis]MCK6207680.1 hypothetical protein [Bacillus infantis]
METFGVKALQLCNWRGYLLYNQIGGPLKSGEKHDGRSPAYDDWTLNGDIIFWYPVLEKAIELSSMGIRVDHLALTKQLEESNCQDRANHEFHSMVLNKKLPFTRARDRSLGPFQKDSRGLSLGFIRY